MHGIITKLSLRYFQIPLKAQNGKKIMKDDGSSSDSLPVQHTDLSLVQDPAGVSPSPSHLALV